MKKVIVFEPNPYHNEVLPGIVKYFEDLNYIADVYVREECFADNPFCRYRIRGKRISYRIEEAKKVLSDEKIREYDFIFFSSMEHCENGEIKRFLTEIGIIPKAKYGILGMYHTNWLINEFDDYELLNQGRLFCISPFQKRGYSKLRWMSPIYFGDNCKQKNSVINEKKNILIVGNISDISSVVEAWWSLDKMTRDKLVIKHIGKLPIHDKSIKGYLYRAYVKFFSVVDYRHKSTTFINRLGSVSFERMFQEIEKSDFLMTTINPDYDSDRHYLESSTSGIRQLAIGFGKPLIIQNEVAKIYDIPEEASVNFSRGKLNEVLKRLANMSDGLYNTASKSMLNFYEYTFARSLSNLRDATEKLCDMEK